MKKRRLVSTVKKVKIPPTESNEKFEGVAPVPLLAGGGGGAITTFHSNVTLRILTEGG